MSLVIVAVAIRESLGVASDSSHRECIERTQLPSALKIYPLRSFMALDFTSPENIKTSGALDTYAKTHLQDSNWDVIVNGSFTDNGPAIEDIVMNGKIEHIGMEDEFKGGGIAQLSDGSLVVCDIAQARIQIADGPHQDARIQMRRVDDLKVINQFCAQHGASVKEFMGGGSTFIKNGNPVPENQVLHAQTYYTQNHTVVASKGAHVYLIQGTLDSLARTQALFCDAGFDMAVKFDGSTGFFNATKVIQNGKTTLESSWPTAGLVGLALKLK